MNRPSRVYIVGAGSGYPGNMTLDALDVLQRADVIVYDRLIPDDVIKYARDDAILIYAGKEPGKHSLSQNEINEVLLTHALKGRTVVRLKGGDPLFYGRGEEECLHLLRHNVPCRIIPGIPSPFAVASRFLIPLAGRGFSSSVAFTTGIMESGKPLSSERIRRLLEAADTVVFLMATRLYPQIVKETIDVRGSTEAIAVVEDLGKRDKLLLGHAGSSNIVGYSPTPPAIIIVGGAARWALVTRERSMYY